MKPQKATSSYFVILACVSLLAQICLAKNLSTAGLASPDAATRADVDSDAMLADTSWDSSGDPTAADPKPAPTVDSNPNKLKVVIYPIEGWAPIMGASFHLPDTPSTPGGGSGKTDISINGAAMFGLTIQKARWYGDFGFEYAGLSASHTNPHVSFNVNGKFATGFVGYDIWKNIYITGGFRYLGLPYDITLGDFATFHRTPGVTDPLVGLMWNRQVSKKWTMNLNLQGGGFGVGSDEDVSAVGKADWQFVKHFGLMFGYGVLHFQISDTKLGKTLKVRQTLNGPQFGFGIYF